VDHAGVADVRHESVLAVGAWSKLRNRDHRPTDPGRLLVATGKVDNPRNCFHPYTVRGGQMGPELTCGPWLDWTVSPDGRRAVIGSTVVDLANGRVGPELMGKLGIFFPHWEDSTHVLTQVMGSDPQGQPLTPIWVRCDVSNVLASRHPSTVRTAPQP